MTRILLALLCGSVLAGCSRSDVLELAEGIRIRAEGIGAQAEIRREYAALAAVGDGDYGTVRTVDQTPEPEKAAETEKAAAKPPQQPTEVVIQAY